MPRTVYRSKKSKLTKLGGPVFTKLPKTQYDELISLEELTPHSTNNELRDNGITEDLKQQYDNVKALILTDGLRVAILVLDCGNGMYLIISGHTRRKCFIDLGATKIPVQWVDWTEQMIEDFADGVVTDINHPDILSMMNSENVRLEASGIGKFLAIEARKKSHNAKYVEKARPTDIEHFCKENNFGYETYKKVKLLRDGGDLKVKYLGKYTTVNCKGKKALFDELVSGKATNIQGQVDKLTEDWELTNDPARKVYPKDREIEKLFAKIDFVRIHQYIFDEMTRRYKERYFKLDAGYQSETMHHILCAEVVEEFNKLGSKYRAVPDTNQDKYDIHFYIGDVFKNTLEVKTTSESTWMSGQPKDGYLLLYEFEKNREGIPDQAAATLVYAKQGYQDREGHYLWRKASKTKYSLSRKWFIEFLESKESSISIQNILGDYYFNEKGFAKVNYGRLNG